MTRRALETLEEALAAAFDHLPPFGKPMAEMNARELIGARIRQQWVLGMRVHYRQSVASAPVVSDREYLTEDAFRKDHETLVRSAKVENIEFYVYRLANDPSQVIHLEELSRMPLDSQLREYTGDGYTTGAFYNEGDPKSSLRAAGIIVHSKTGQRFFVPAAPAHRFA